MLSTKNISDWCRKKNYVEVHVDKSFFVPISDDTIRQKVNEYLDEHI